MRILSQYVSSRAAENLLRRALALGAPSRPEDWARLVEEGIWPELKRLLPFREMPPELKAWVRERRLLAPPEEDEEGGEAALWEPVDLEDPALRARLAQRLARLEGVVGVVVAGESGREEFFAEEPVSLDPAHLLLRRQGYRTFYAVLGERLVALRALGQGYVGIAAHKETNVGRLLHGLRRLLDAKEVEG